LIIQTFLNRESTGDRELLGLLAKHAARRMTRQGDKSSRSFQVLMGWESILPCPRAGHFGAYHATFSARWQSPKKGVKWRLGALPPKMPGMPA
jgi:hypothetical protein